MVSHSNLLNIGRMFLTSSEIKAIKSGSLSDYLNKFATPDLDSSAHLDFRPYNIESMTQSRQYLEQGSQVAQHRRPRPGSSLRGQSFEEIGD